MLIPLKSSSLVLMISSMSMLICSRFHARRAISGIITTFSGYPSLTPAYAGLLKPMGSGLGLQKSTFGVENFMCRLSW